MQKQNNIKFYLKTTAILTIIVSLTALLMAVVNGLTAGKIEENMRAAIENAITELFPGSANYEKLDAEFKLPVTDIWRVDDGYCIFATVKGFKEDINIIVGADATGKCIGVKILSFAETQGLGSLIGEADYLSQYFGKTAGMILNHDIDAVTGATISSRALLEGVNAALAVDIFNTTETADVTAAETEEGETSNEQITEQP